MPEPLQPTPPAPQSPSGIRFRWPDDTVPPAHDNFFVGYWRADPVRVDWSLPTGLAAEIRHGANWSMVSAVSPLHEPALSLLSVTSDAQLAVAFRGYVLAPPVHSYSLRADVLGYWQKHGSIEHNGVFSTAIASVDSLQLATDYLGLGPLYYRWFKGGVAFSTNPRYLAVAGDAPDLVAWRESVQAEFLASDRSLSSRVMRVPAGCTLRASQSGMKVEPWFNFDRLPPGEKPVGSDAVKRVEHAFMAAMERCLRLTNGERNLLFSSGHDSRRMLTYLLAHNEPFHAVTARVFQKEHRDLDARYSAEMARDFGFSHQIVEPASVEQFVADDVARRHALDSETRAHTWMVQVMRELPQKPSLLLDGVLGDILGNPGFRLNTLYKSPRDDIEVIADTCITDAYDHVLKPSAWPSTNELKDDLRSYLEPFAHRPNVAELAFILFRQRRMTALGTHQLHPPGHVVVAPFADLEYVKQLLTYRPKEKHAANFQRACLNAFWPQFAKYPGNRDIPPDMPPGSPEHAEQREVACLRQLQHELTEAGLLADARGRLGITAKLRTLGAGMSNTLALNTAWFNLPLMELEARRAQARGCWSAT